MSGYRVKTYPSTCRDPAAVIFLRTSVQMKLHLTGLSRIGECCRQYFGKFPRHLQMRILPNRLPIRMVWQEAAALELGIGRQQILAQSSFVGYMNAGSGFVHSFCQYSHGPADRQYGPCRTEVFE